MIKEFFYNSIFEKIIIVLIICTIIGMIMIIGIVIISDDTIDSTLETICYPALKYCVTSEGKIPMEETMSEIYDDYNCLAVHIGTIVIICD